MSDRPSHFAEISRLVAELAADGRDVIRLDVGSPDLPPAPFIIEALQRSAQRPDRHGYHPFAGPVELRRAWSEMYERVFDVDLDPETEVLPLLGSKEGIFHLTLAVAKADDIVLVPDPGYPTYARSARLLGAVPYPFALDPRRGYLPDLSSIPAAIVARARMLWINYPNNPTAAVADLALLAEAVDFARANGLLLCHDAAYTQVNLEGDVSPSLLQVPGAREVAVELNSLSKSHNMAGWRLGVAVGNPAALEKLMRVKAEADNGHFLAVTEAAIVALTGDQAWIAERNAEYRRRRDLVLQGLNQAGLRASPSKATLYVWAGLPNGWRSEAFAAGLLGEAGVAVTPGDVYGARGEGYIRISLGTPHERIAEGMRRLQVWVTSTEARA